MTRRVREITHTQFVTKQNIFIQQSFINTYFDSINNDRLRFDINEEMPSIRSTSLFKKRIKIPLAFDPQFESFSRAVKKSYKI